VPLVERKNSLLAESKLLLQWEKRCDVFIAAKLLVRTDKGPAAVLSVRFFLQGLGWNTRERSPCTVVRGPNTLLPKAWKAAVLGQRPRQTLSHDLPCLHQDDNSSPCLRHTKTALIRMPNDHRTQHCLFTKALDTKPRFAVKRLGRSGGALCVFDVGCLASPPIHLDPL
jgi:hypothetical protein